MPNYVLNCPNYIIGIL